MPCRCIIGHARPTYYAYVCRGAIHRHGMQACLKPHDTVRLFQYPRPQTDTALCLGALIKSRRYQRNAAPLAVITIRVSGAGVIVLWSPHSKPILYSTPARQIHGCKSRMRERCVKEPDPMILIKRQKTANKTGHRLPRTDCTCCIGMVDFVAALLLVGTMPT